MDTECCGSCNKGKLEMNLISERNLEMRYRSIRFGVTGKNRVAD
jgi:hypothetical protein